MDPKVLQKLDTFFSQFKRMSYKKGEILIRTDDEPSGAFYLKDGVVRRYSISPKGEELTLNIYKPVSFFPMDWVINDAMSSHYYEAMTPLIVWRAPKEEVKKFIKSNPDVLYDLVSRIYRGLEGYMMRLEYSMFGNAYARLITEILIAAKRFGQKGGDKTVVSLKLTEKDLASASGIARETVSRNLRELKQKGLVAFRSNQLTVINIHKLEEELLDI